MSGRRRSDMPARQGRNGDCCLRPRTRNVLLRKSLEEAYLCASVWMQARPHAEEQRSASEHRRSTASARCDASRSMRAIGRLVLILRDARPPARLGSTLSLLRMRTSARRLTAGVTLADDRGINASPFRGDPHEVLRSPDRSRLDRRRGSRCEPSAGTGAKPNGAGDGNETRSHHRRPSHPQGDARQGERVAAETRRLSQTGAPTENPIAEAACLRQSLHVALIGSDIAVSGEAASGHALTGR